MVGQIKTYGRVKAKRRVFIELSCSPSPRKVSGLTPIKSSLNDTVQIEDETDDGNDHDTISELKPVIPRVKLKEIISPTKKVAKLSKSAQKENSITLARLEIARTPVKRHRKVINLAESPIDTRPLKKATGKAKLAAANRKPLADLNSSLNALSLNGSTTCTLDSILAECGQTRPSNFSAYLSPFLLSSDCKITKIGEATYSEVYQCSSTNEVLKIVPICPDGTVQMEDSPWASPFTDAMREVQMSTCVAKYSKAFVSISKAHIVTGTYPASLLREWDLYSSDIKNKSQSIRPDIFMATQKYLVMHLEHVGIELEKYKFSAKSKNSQALNIFSQICRSLAHAEKVGRFEHRDLHLGNLMIREEEADNPKVTIIDFGLSRTDQFYYQMDDPGLFNQNKMGKEKDIQYDVYDDMKFVTKSDWKKYHPVSNFLWLRYILRKLIDTKGLKKPVKTKSGLNSSEDAIWRKIQELMELMNDNYETIMNNLKGAKIQSAADMSKFL